MKEDYPNNFQRLLMEDEERYKPEIDQLKKDLNGSMDLFRFIGNIVEIYVPRFFDMMVVTSGGGRVKKRMPHDHVPPGSGREESGPRGPGEIDGGLR
ncbi:MAG: hypothetical protein R2824_26660 [Saprospiraceae bacterium]